MGIRLAIAFMDIVRLLLPYPHTSQRFHYYYRHLPVEDFGTDRKAYVYYQNPE